MYHHRPGKQRQSNKEHKAVPTSKRAVAAASHGRVERGVPGTVGARKSVKSNLALASEGKANRANHARQLKEARRAEELVARRLGGGGASGTPKFVSVVALGASADCNGVVAALVSASDGGAVAPVDGDAIGAPICLSYAALRARLLVTAAPRGGAVVVDSKAQPVHLDVTHTLAAARSADVIVLVLNVGGIDRFEASVDAEGDLFMTCLRATGVPTIVGVLQGCASLTPSHAADARRWATRFFATEWGADVRVVEAESPLLTPVSVAPVTTKAAKSGAAARAGIAAAASATALARVVIAAPARAVTWRSQRSYFVAQAASFEPAELAGTASATVLDADAPRRLTLLGHLRGRPLNVHQLVCLPGAGVYAIDAVECMPSSTDPCFARAGSAARASPAALTGGHAMTLDHEGSGLTVLPSMMRGFPSELEVRVRRSIVLSPSKLQTPAGRMAASTRVVPADAFREPLDILATPDVDEAMGAEQTWPTDADGGDDDDDDDDVDAKGSSDDDVDGGVDADVVVHDPLPPDERQARDAAIRSEAIAARDRLKERRRRRRRGGADEDEDAEDGDSGDDDGGVRITAAVDDDGGLEDGDAGGDVESAAAAAAAIAARRSMEARDQTLFPDEIDTPFDIPARERFARYRGLKSLRTSPWDARESLPSSYARIFTLPRFTATQRRVLAEAALADRALHTLESAKIEAERAAAKLAGRSRRTSGVASVAAPKAASAGAAASCDSEGTGAVDIDVDVEATEGDIDIDIDDENAVAGQTRAAADGNAIRDLQRRPKFETLGDVLGAGWVATGQLVRVTLLDVRPSTLAACLAPGVPLVPIALLRHENKTSVVHFNVVRVSMGHAPDATATHAGSSSTVDADASASAPLDTVKARDELEIHVGPRVFDAKPLFSQPAGGGGGSAGAARNKLDRFLIEGRWAVTTAFGPLVFGPMPVLIFRRVFQPTDDAVGAAATAAALGEVYPAPDTVNLAAANRIGSRLELVATGSYVGAEPDTAVLKRVLLSGFPIRVKNRFAVVRYMFFNPADVAYFRPLELHTKHGCVGSIREAVGTHGSMKCIFDRPITQQDTVCLPLYKRVYPQWGHAYVRFVGTDAAAAAAAEFQRGL